MARYGITDRLTGGTPTANDATYGAVVNAVDNNEATHWQTNTSKIPAWFKYDCGAGVIWAFGKLRCKPYGSSYGPNAFNVTSSNNDSDYTTLYTGNMANNSNWQEFTWINSIKYRYIKINITSSYEVGNSVAVYEFEAMEMIKVGGLGIGNPWIFMKDMWEKHDKLWQPKLILPKDLEFQI